MFKFKKRLALIVFLMTLSGCKSLEDVISQNPPSTPSVTSNDTSTGEDKTSEVDVTSIIDSITSDEDSSTSEEEIIEGDLQPADLTNFTTDFVVDPAISYTSEDFVVKPFYNGFTYPSDAQVQPTNAYLEFWHEESKINFHIVASKRVFSLIEQNGFFEQRYADLYFPVTLAVDLNGKRFVYYEVGMRMKGNTSRKQFLHSETKEFVDSVSFKLSFNETWTKDLYAEFGLQKTWNKNDNPEWKIRDDRTFMGDDAGKFGMKKIDIKWNKSKDPSLIMQPYAFGFFQKHGLISQNSTLTTLKFNNTRMGIVTLNEPVNKHLLRRYFPKAAAAGDLYKVGWGYGEMGNLFYEKYEEKNEIVGEEDKYNYYSPIYDAKEYDDTAAEPFGKLINLMRVLKENEGKSVEEYAPVLSSVVDIDSFLNYAALAYLIGNPDDMRNWGNNYYIFFNPLEDNKAYFIPYDYDWSLGLTWDLQNLPMLGVSPYTTKHAVDRNRWQSNRLYWYTIIQSSDSARPYPSITMNQAWQDTYSNKLIEYNNDPLYSKEGYNELYFTYKTTYGHLSESDLDFKLNAEGHNLGEISPFVNTSLMENFIDDVKSCIETYVING